MKLIGYNHEKKEFYEIEKKKNGFSRILCYSTGFHYFHNGKEISEKEWNLLTKSV